MIPILLSEDNLDALEAIAKRACLAQAVRSAHITEALAYGLGFATQAALLAKTRSVPEFRSFLAEFDQGRFVIRLLQLGYALNENAALFDDDGLRNLPDRTWIDIEANDMGKQNFWFHQCKLRNIPFIYVARRRKYAELQWDCVSVDPAHEAHVQGDRGADLVRGMFATFQAVARKLPSKALFEGKSMVGSVKGLPIELVPELADAFFAALYKPMQDYGAPA